MDFLHALIVVLISFLLSYYDFPSSYHIDTLWQASGFTVHGHHSSVYIVNFGIGVVVFPIDGDYVTGNIWSGNQQTWISHISIRSKISPESVYLLTIVVEDEFVVTKRISVCNLYATICSRKDIATESDGWIDSH